MGKVLLIVMIGILAIFALGCMCFGAYETLYVFVKFYIGGAFLLMFVLGLSSFRRWSKNEELK